MPRISLFAADLTGLTSQVYQQRLCCIIISDQTRFRRIGLGRPGGLRRFETRSLPELSCSYPRHFTLITRTTSCLRQLP